MTDILTLSSLPNTEACTRTIQSLEAESWTAYAEFTNLINNHSIFSQVGKDQEACDRARQRSRSPYDLWLQDFVFLLTQNIRNPDLLKDIADNLESYFPKYLATHIALMRGMECLCRLTKADGDQNIYREFQRLNPDIQTASTLVYLNDAAWTELQRITALQKRLNLATNIATGQDIQDARELLIEIKQERLAEEYLALDKAIGKSPVEAHDAINEKCIKLQKSIFKQLGRIYAKRFMGYACTHVRPIKLSSAEKPEAQASGRMCGKVLKDLGLG